MRTTDDGTVVESSKAGQASLCKSGRNFRCAKSSHSNSSTAQSSIGEMLRDSRSSTPYAKAVLNVNERRSAAAVQGTVAALIVLL